MAASLTWDELLWRVDILSKGQLKHSMVIGVKRNGVASESSIISIRVAFEWMIVSVLLVTSTEAHRYYWLLFLGLDVISV